METIKPFSAFARLFAAGALAFGLMMGAVSVPQAAFADTDGGASSAVDAESSVTVAEGNVTLTKQGDDAVLVALTDADNLRAADVGLEARSADGTALAGASFTFSPVAEALPTDHVVQNGAELRVVVSNGTGALSRDASLELGTFTLPEGAAKVAVTQFAQIGTDGAEGIATISPDDELVMAEGGSTPPPDEGNTAPGGNTTVPGGNTTVPGGNTTNPGGNTTVPGGNTSDIGGSQNPDGSGGAGNNGNDGGTGSGAGGANGGSGSGNSNLPQTGDGQLMDISALLLIAGAAALIGGVNLILRRTTRS